MVSAAMVVALLPVFAVWPLIKAPPDGAGCLRYSGRSGALLGRTFRMPKVPSMVSMQSVRPRLEVHNERTGRFQDELDPRVTAIGRFIRKYSLDELAPADM